MMPLVLGDIEGGVSRARRMQKVFPVWTEPSRRRCVRQFVAQDE